MSDHPNKYPCVKCGMCCTKRPCVYGEWDVIHSQCKELTSDNKCRQYEYIVELEKNSEYPMFGCGCSSPLFNTMRDKKIKEMVA